MQTAGVDDFQGQAPSLFELLLGCRACFEEQLISMLTAFPSLVEVPSLPSLSREGTFSHLGRSSTQVEGYSETPLEVVEKHKM